MCRVLVYRPILVTISLWPEPSLSYVLTVDKVPQRPPNTIPST